MIILIPLGGIGQRFKDDGYKNPKAFIKVSGKPIISHLLDNIKVDGKLVYIPYNKEYKSFDIENKLTQLYPKIKFKFLCLEKKTQGAAETINIALNQLISDQIKYPINMIQQKKMFDQPILCLDCDNFYLCDIINTWNGKNCVFTFKDYKQNPVFSYIKERGDKLIDIKEKVKISDDACTGAYGFDSYYNLYDYTTKIINQNIKQKNEFYTSGVIKSMLKDGIDFKNISLLNKHYFSLGTPKNVIEYEHPFIFDLDGTLVNTDNIYIDVWKDIMKEYNLPIDENFFNFFIQGKNDISFLKYIFSDIDNIEIKKISNMKDELFIKYLEKYNQDIFINGADKFIKENSNRRMVIVTSCNKKAAEYILKKTKIEEYIQLLIASEDCEKHKPDKLPYQMAVNFLQCDKNKCAIFEDSNSGYKSAKSLGGAKICLIINKKSSNFIINSTDYQIDNYNKFDYLKLLSYKTFDIKNVLIEKLNNLPINDIIINNVNLKTGYICDIKSLTLKFNNSYDNVILKLENEDNELSIVARKLNLYSNELYFYENISGIININAPKFFCSLKLNKKKGILLENLNDYNGVFNLNLNKNVDPLICVIRKISDMHNRFYYETKNDLIPSMQKLKTLNEITYYKELINIRFDKFLSNNNIMLSKKETIILNNVYNNYNKITNILSCYPLSFCHGDCKSPNIFYKRIGMNYTPIFLDWQYIHLNKGISDIVFLLVESIEYDKNIIDLVLNYYYKKTIMYKNFQELLLDFKLCLCTFPFFVIIWFNSENRDNLLDKVFPINFMKNTLKYYNYFLDDDFFETINKY
tara:strand:+ start:1608 stop:4028 length:2421 start_codon:yes stop_codon:yes gene_type:complete